MLALTWAFPVSSFAAAQADLVVGSVRDDDGAPIVRAHVRLVDGRGSITGTGLTDEHGTFAIEPNAMAVSA